MEYSVIKILTFGILYGILEHLNWSTCQFSSVAQLCPTLCDTMDCSTSGFLSITNSWSLPKLMSIESVMPSNHLILCRPLLPCLQSFPASGPFLVSQLFTSGGQSTGVSASASVLPVNIQDWSPWSSSLWNAHQSSLGDCSVIPDTSQTALLFTLTSAVEPC